MSQIIRITDRESGAEALVAPELGFNCFHFAVPHNGQMLDILWSAPNFAAGTERPSGSGIPLLFPFPGRIRGTSFEWEGKTYELEEGDGCGNAIHGFVMRRPWRVIGQTENSVSGEFQASVDDPSLLKRWPADFRIEAMYRIDERSLVASYRFTNPSDSSLPYGFGTHAYFRVPLGGPSAADCRLVGEVTNEWELAHMIPTGGSQPVPDAAEFAKGLRLGERKFDTVFSGNFCTPGNAPQGNLHSTKIIDPHSQVTLTQSCVGSFPYCVAYTPPHREAVCLEPYSCLPDYFRLAREGVETGMRTIAPGEAHAATIAISVDGDIPG